MTREEFIKKLKEKNAEYASIYLVLENYEKYQLLFNRYFCYKKVSSENNDEQFVYSQRLATENLTFLENWLEREKKIRARLKKNKYMSRGGKISDERELKDSSRKFAELNLYFDLDKEFSQIENIDEYIKKLKDRKEKIEKFVLNNRKKSESPGESQPQ